MAKPYAAAASEVHVALAARHVLEKGGNAVDAVVAGVLAAVAESPGVFLGPLQVLAAGGGAGLLAIDGRVRQPGIGIPRPRGLVAGAEVPAAARMGVPGLPFALATAHGSLGEASLRSIAAPAVARARDLSPERAAVIDVFARRGTAALTGGGFVEDVVAAAGRAAGGMLTGDDLAAFRPAVVAQDEASLDAGLLAVPWRFDGTSARSGHRGAPQDAYQTHVVAAGDAHGLFVAACYESPPDGLPLSALGLVGPLLAAPVKRGEPRIRPGEPRPAAAPVALRVRGGVADLAVGVALAVDAEAQLVAILGALDDGTLVPLPRHRSEGAPALAEALGGSGTGRVVALARPREVPVVLRSA